MGNFPYIFKVELTDKKGEKFIIRIFSSFFAYNLRNCFKIKGMCGTRIYQSNFCRKCKQELVLEKVVCLINGIEKTLWVFFCPKCHQPYPEKGEIKLESGGKEFDIFGFYAENK